MKNEIYIEKYQGGYAVIVSGHIDYCIEWCFTLWGAKRVLKRYIKDKKQEIIYRKELK